MVVRLLVAGISQDPPGQWIAKGSVWKKTFVTSVSHCRAASYLQM
jgi:hypothetical protein